MNKVRQKLVGFLLSLVASGIIFFIVAIPLFGIFTQPAQNSFEPQADLGGEFSLFLAFYDHEEFLSYEVTLDLQSRIAEVKALANDLTLSKVGKTCRECYEYGGLSYLSLALRAVSGLEIENFVIITKKNAKKYLDFIGGAIVTRETGVYNNNVKVNGADFFDAVENFGAEAVICSVVYGTIGQTRANLAQNLTELCRLSDTTLSPSVGKEFFKNY